jgi:hypothetical protein
MTKTISLTIINLITPKAGSYRELLFNKLVLAPYLRLIYTRKVYHLKKHVEVTVVILVFGGMTQIETILIQSHRGAQKLMGENLKVLWAEFSILS